MVFLNCEENSFAGDSVQVVTKILFDNQNELFLICLPGVGTGLLRQEKETSVQLNYYGKVRWSEF